MSFEASANLISAKNVNSFDETTLAAGATWQGVAEDVSNYARAGVAITTDNATDGTLTFEVSHDNITWGGPERTWSDTRYAQPHTWNIVEKWIRIKYVNGSTIATNPSIQTQYSKNAQIFLAHQLNEVLKDETEAIATRSVLVGKTEGGTYKNVPVNGYGEIVVELPKAAFGELLVTEKTPQVQEKFPYGVNDLSVQTLLNNTSGGSAVTSSGGVVSVVAAGTYPSFGQIRTLDTVAYRPGEGSEAEFTAAFPSGGVALSSQHAGPGDDDELLAFGYNGADFGVHHHSHGELEIRSITITAAATGTGNITITMDGTAVTVAITSGDTIAEICALIVAEQQDFQNAGRGWEVHTDDNVSVEFISLVAEPAAGTFSFVDTDTTGVTAGTFNQATTSILGIVPTSVHIAQASWNVDTMDGSGDTNNPSGVLLGSGATPGEFGLDTDELVPYRIAWQFLGAGALEYFVEKPNGAWQSVHKIRRSGSSSLASLRNPTLHLTLIAKTESGYSGGNLTMLTASMAGFIQGKEGELGIRHSVDATRSITSTTQTNVVTIHSDLEYNGTRNKIVSYPDLITIANEVTKTIVVIITVNPTEVSGTVNLQAVDSGRTPMEYDTAGILITGGTQLLPITVAGAGTTTIDLKVLGAYLRPGDRWVISAAKTSGGSNGDVNIGITWKDRL